MSRLLITMFILFTVTRGFASDDLQTLELSCDNFKSAEITLDQKAGVLEVIISNILGNVIFESAGALSHANGELGENLTSFASDASGTQITTGLVPKKSLFASPWEYDKVTSIHLMNGDGLYEHHLSCKH